jgi:myo-inositol-1(or 4)-monophosphatase
MKNLISIFPVLEEMNRGAGEIVRKYFGSRMEVDVKTDLSPVTRVDREVESFLRESIERHFPDHSILGEEFGETKKQSAYCWIIDPIDGTRSFILNTPLFGTLLALEQDGEPILGSIYLPIQRSLMIGSAETGTFLDGKRCNVSKTAELRTATLLITNPKEIAKPEGGQNLINLCNAAGLVRGFGDCYGYFLVACGAADAMFDSTGIKYYDIAPMKPILEGAGGRFTAKNGRIDFNCDSGLATNALLHEQIVQILNA